MIRAVIFDFDGTLSSEREYIYGCFKFVTSYIEEKFEIRDAYNKLVQLFNESWNDTFGRLLKSEKVAYKDEDIRELVKIYRNAPPIVKLYADSLPVIKFLKDNNIKIAILTNGYYEIQNEKIQRSGLGEYIDVVEIPDLYGREFWKPDVRRAEVLLEKLGTKACEVLYVGDSDSDYKVATAMNMPVAFIKREDKVNEFSFAKQVKYTIESLEELKNLI